MSTHYKCDACGNEMSFSSRKIAEMSIKIVNDTSGAGRLVMDLCGNCAPATSKDLAQVVEVTVVKALASED